MHFQYVPYLWLLLVSAIITAALAMMASRQRGVAGAAAFAALMGLATLWTLANGLEMAGTDLPTKLFWANAQYLCYVSIPVAWLALALQISGWGEWLTRRNLALLAIEPVVTVALVWTDPAHGLLRRNIHLDTAGPFPVIAKTFGPWFWVHAAYTYLLLAITLFLLIDALRRAPPLYRHQRLTLLAGAVLPLVMTVWGVVAWLWTLTRTQCNRCYNLSCPLNRVPDAVRERFFEHYPLFAEGWKE